jgi:hypothetical protein
LLYIHNGFQEAGTLSATGGEDDERSLFSPEKVAATTDDRQPLTRREVVQENTDSVAVVANTLLHGTGENDASYPVSSPISMPLHPIFSALILVTSGWIPVARDSLLRFLASRLGSLVRSRISFNMTLVDGWQVESSCDFGFIDHGTKASCRVSTLVLMTFLFSRLAEKATRLHEQSTETRHEVG